MEAVVRWGRGGHNLSILVTTTLITIGSAMFRLPPSHSFFFMTSFAYARFQNTTMKTVQYSSITCLHTSNSRDMSSAWAGFRNFRVLLAFNMHATLRSVQTSCTSWESSDVEEDVFREAHSNGTMGEVSSSWEATLSSI